MHPAIVLAFIVFVVLLGWLIVRLLPTRCWQCGELTKWRTPGGLYACADCGGRPPCEACGEMSRRIDAEGVHLCKTCYEASPHAAHCPCRDCKAKGGDKQLAELLEEEMARIEEGRLP